jgi:hypothetical protein
MEDLEIDEVIIAVSLSMKTHLLLKNIPYLRDTETSNPEFGSWAEGAIILGNHPITCSFDLVFGQVLIPHDRGNTINVISYF